jgi:metal-sulfur cluster biosynthetic enzyme
MYTDRQIDRQKDRQTENVYVKRRKEQKMERRETEGLRDKQGELGNRETYILEYKNRDSCKWEDRETKSKRDREIKRIERVSERLVKVTWRDRWKTDRHRERERERESQADKHSQTEYNRWVERQTVREREIHQNGVSKGTRRERDLEKET